MATEPQTAKSKLSPVKRAFIALEKMQAKMAAMEALQKEPIAVVGMSCRFPQSANQDEFWANLKRGFNGVTEVPPERWDVDQHFDADYVPGQNSPTKGKAYARWGGFLDNVDQFDPAFFNISPREAVSMDPQQRLLLEVAWEALEDAGQIPETLAETKTGVYVGIMNNDYFQLQLKYGSVNEYDQYTATGFHFSVACGRLSFFLKLQGPSLAVDTACSASLTSVHVATKALLNNECRMALAGGVNLFLVPESYIERCQGTMLSPTGLCHTFDESGDGYAPGEGVGIVVLKRLSHAIEDGDNVIALIQGTAINHDGPAGGLTVPNGSSQQRLIRDALTHANIAPQDVGYVECHGTGTALGDPIEVNALAGALGGRKRSKETPLVIRSTKTNIGHLESGAGIGGLMTVILSLKNNTIPPHLHCNNINPKLSLDAVPAHIPKEAMEWPMINGRRIGAVNSFGVGGSNAHAVLEQAPPDPRGSLSDISENDPLYIATFSARAPEALREYAARLHKWLLENDDGKAASLRDILYTLNKRRSQHEFRMTLPTNSREQFIEDLAAIGAGEDRIGLAQGQAVAGRDRKLVFVASGQGSVFWPLAKELLRDSDVFRATIEACDGYFKPLAGWSILEELAKEDPDSQMGQAEYAQPAICAIQLSLCEHWRAWGIEPKAVTGHSLGEISAAYIAGVLTMEEVMRIAYHRGRIMQKIWGIGKMAFVELPVAEIEEELKGLEDKVSVAVVNSPGNAVISGEKEVVYELVEKFKGRDVFSKVLESIDIAGHSPIMDKMRDDFLESIKDIKPRAAKIPIISTVLGEPISGEELTPEYWIRNVRMPVLFGKATQWLLANKYDLFLEIAAHPALSNSIKATIADYNENQTDASTRVEANVLHSLHRDEPKLAVLTGTAGALHANGFPVELERFTPADGRLVRLPTYVWQKKRFWVEADSRRQVSMGEGDAPEEQNKSIESWLFEFDWREKENEKFALSENPAAGTFIIYGDQEDTIAGLTRLLREKNQRCIVLRPGELFNRAGTDEFTIRFDEADDIREILEEIQSVNSDSFRGVVHAWSLDAPKPDAASPETMEASYLTTITSALELLKVMVQLNWEGEPKLWFVTRGAQTVDGDAVPYFTQAATWGLGRTIGRENPGLWGGLLDLDPEQPDSFPPIAGELLFPDGEYQVAFRNNNRYVGRLRKAGVKKSDEDRSKFSADGSYLITGGLGSIGFILARWMIAGGARQFVLPGRTALPPREAWDSVEDERILDRIKTIRELEALGARVNFHPADVSNREQLGALVENLKADNWLPVKGIVHSTAVLESVPLVELEKDRVNRSLHAKVPGAWLLHEMLGDDVDFFVLFSSAAGLVEEFAESAGTYPAANAFLDAFAQYRRSLGKTALSISWGAWGATDFSESDDGRAMLRKLSNQGFGSFDPNQGMEVLDLLLREDKTHVLVTPVSWKRFQTSNPFQRELLTFSELFSPDDTDDASGLSPKEELANAKPEERLAKLEQYFISRLANIQRMSPDNLNVSQPINSTGVDSMMAVELRNRVQQELGISLPVVKILDGSSVANLAAQFIKQLPTGGATSSAKSIELPLGSIQKGLWFAQELMPSSGAFNIHYVAQVISDLDQAALQRAFQKLTNRHMMMRSVFREQDGNLTQVVQDGLKGDFQVIDASAWSQNQQNNTILEEVNRTFDLKKKPGVRFRLFRQGPGANIMVVTAHQIALDKRSLEILLEELQIIYSAEKSGKSAELPAVESQYDKFIARENDFIQSQQGEQLLENWKKKLAGDLQILSLRSDKPRPIEWNDRSRHYRLDVPEPVSKALRKNGNRKDQLLTLLSTFLILIHRSTYQKDLTLGYPIGLRGRTDSGRSLGNYTNPVVLRFQLEDNVGFSEFKSRAAKILQDAVEGGEYPFTELVEKIQPLRYSARSPLFQILFDMPLEETESANEQSEDKLKLIPLEFHNAGMLHEMVLAVEEKHGNFSLNIRYRTDFFTDQAVKNSAVRFITLLETFLQAPETPILDAQFLPERESRQLVEWNQTEKSGEDALIHEIFQEQVRRIPGAAALVDEDREVTYGELNERANKLAHYLNSEGVKKSDHIALCSYRGVDMVVGMLGILKAGAVCVPLDPSLSELRKEHFDQENLNVFARDSKSVFVLTLKELESLFAVQNKEEDTFRVLRLDEDWPAIDSHDSGDPESNVGLEEPGCIIYTDLDEALPSGIIHSHRSLVIATSSVLGFSRLSISSRTLQTSSISSPIALQEIFSTLCSGGLLVFAPPHIETNEIAYAEFLMEQSIERIFLSPNSISLERVAEFAIGQDVVPAFLREIFVTDERLHLTPDVIEIMEQIRGCELYFQFGLPEYPVIAAYHIAEPRRGLNKAMPLGFAADNTRVHILDERGRTAPIGSEGELFVEGDMLAMGYLNRPDLTAERLVPAEDANRPGTRRFRTNYVARYDSAGAIHLVGPVENQVNIRGMLVNLREIETSLERHPAIRRAVCIQKKGVGGNGVLAYIASDRIVDRLSILVKCQVEHDGAQMTLITQNISSTGLSLQGVPDDWTPGHRLPSIKLLLPGLSENVVLEGTVTRVEDNIAGIKFEEMTLLQKSLLKVSLAHIIEMESVSLTEADQGDYQVPLVRTCRANTDDSGTINLVSNKISAKEIVFRDVPTDWPQGKQVEIELTLPVVLDQVKLQCRLAWKDGAFTGFDFQANPEDQQALERFFMNFTQNQVLSIAHLRFYLKERLPYSMIPAYFITMDTLPRLPNGRINRAGLHVMLSRMKTVNSGAEPRTPVEGIIAQILEENLGRKVGIHENFFDMGGHSLMAARITTLINNQFNSALPLRTIFSAPTVADLASFIVHRNAEEDEKEELRMALNDLDTEDLREILRKHLLEEAYE